MRNVVVYHNLLNFSPKSCVNNGLRKMVNLFDLSLG